MISYDIAILETQDTKKYVVLHTWSNTTPKEFSMQSTITIMLYLGICVICFSQVP